MELDGSFPYSKKLILLKTCVTFHKKPHAYFDRFTPEGPQLVGCPRLSIHLISTIFTHRFF
jgi:hypothetical protein